MPYKKRRQAAKEKVVKAEPAVIGAAVAAVVNAIVLLVFKQELGTEEKAAIVTLVTLAASLWVRSKVTPTG